MKDKFLLFKYNKANNKSLACSNEYQINCFVPKPWKLLIDNHRIGIAEIFFRFYISVLTLGNTKIFYIDDENGNTIHSSYVIPKNIKYPFLQKNQLAIGPCNTVSTYRGKGIYPLVLKHITEVEKNQEFFMFIREENKSSIRGVEKAGFETCNEYITNTMLLKRFYKTK